MPRPKSVNPTVAKEIYLDQRLVAKVDLALFSELEGRVPQGAWQRLLTQLLQQWLKETGNE